MSHVILVVDDEPVICKSCEKVFRRAGHTTTIATSGREALALLKSDTFDVVFTVCGHADENCPAFIGTPRVIHVGFDDPPKLAKNAASEEEALGHYRRVRDEIRAAAGATAGEPHESTVPLTGPELQRPLGVAIAPSPFGDEAPEVVAAVRAAGRWLCGRRPPPPRTGPDRRGRFRGRNKLRGSRSADRWPPRCW